MISGGQWFDGQRFVARTMFIRDGVFVSGRAGDVWRDHSVSGYVVAPFADAHNHGIGTGSEDRDRAMIAAYERSGVFYAQIQGNLPISNDDKLRLGLGGDSGLEAIFAQGSITGPGGHPMGIIRDVLLSSGYFPGETLDSLRNRRFYEIGSEAELHEKWPLIEASGSDFVKFFLFNSEDYAARRDDARYFGRRGLDPDLAPLVVRLAHADGKRASAHVVSLADFRTVLHAGVDMVAHLPDEAMTPADAAETARRGIVVTTTCAYLARLTRARTPDVAAIQAINLRLLRDAGAHLAIGSDDPNDPSMGEIAYLSRLGVFAPGELLALWTEATPRAIFPERRIGRLLLDHEASFLVLNTDPLDNLARAPSIEETWKRGRRLI